MSVSLQKRLSIQHFNEDMGAPIKEPKKIAAAEKVWGRLGSSQLCLAIQQMPLCRKESELLRVLAQMNCQVIAERDLVEKAWNCEYDETASLYMEMYFRRLRTKLQDHNPELKLTRQRCGDSVGYRLIRELAA